eukprot:m.12752 g.12752  ORF g.12752 m.12752 type:complete len:415 (-) comp7885_c0_seq1:65-1309(-)
MPSRGGYRVLSRRSLGYYICLTAGITLVGASVMFLVNDSFNPDRWHMPHDDCPGPDQPMPAGCRNHTEARVPSNGPRRSEDHLQQGSPWQEPQQHGAQEQGQHLAGRPPLHTRPLNNERGVGSSTSAAPTNAAAGPLRVSNASVVLLIRGHALTRAMLDRISDWAKEGITTATVPLFDVALSLDTTSRRGQRDLAMAHFRHRRVERLVAIHTYTETEMLAQFPALIEARAGAVWGDAQGSAALGFHVEAIVLWYRGLSASQRNQYRHVWVFEADVAYSGPKIARVLGAYGNADLVTKKCIPIPTGWIHAAAVSAAYNASVPQTQRQTTVEAVQRFSAKLMGVLATRLDQGQHAWSEQAACSFAAVEALSIAALRTSDVGMPFSYGSRQKVTQFNFERYAHHRFRQNKLYHPVKF